MGRRRGWRNDFALREEGGKLGAVWKVRRTRVAQGACEGCWSFPGERPGWWHRWVLVEATRFTGKSQLR